MVRASATRLLPTIDFAAVCKIEIEGVAAAAAEVPYIPNGQSFPKRISSIITRSSDFDGFYNTT